MTEISKAEKPLEAMHISVSGDGTNKYPAKQHAQAVARQLGFTKSDPPDGIIYLPGQHTLYREDSDMTYPFRQRRYFYYLSGVNEPDCYLTYDIRNDVLTLYIPPINPRAVLWFGKGSTIKYDVDCVKLSTDTSNDLWDWLFSHPKAYCLVLHPDQLPSPNKHLPDIPLSKYEASSLGPAIDACRGIKDSHEISLIRKAVEISSIAHRSVLHHITAFKSEAEIHAHFLDICIAHGAKLQGYPPIVASGTNAATLHYTDNDAPLEGRGLVCLDAACEWECYSADITRTFPINVDGWASKETAEIYAIVEDMQERCIEQLKPGVRYLDLHFLAHHIAIEGLTRLGIFKVEYNREIVEKGYSKAIFPHGLGHHLGLEMHDVSGRPLLGLQDGGIAAAYSGYGCRSGILLPERYTAFSRDSSYKAPCTEEAPLLEADMVLTVEPGLYFSEYVLKHGYLQDPGFLQVINKEVLDRYMHVGGVRIEDDILITADGFENLTTTPKGKEMMDVICEGAEGKRGKKCKH